MELNSLSAKTAHYMLTTRCIINQQIVCAGIVRVKPFSQCSRWQLNNAFSFHLSGAKHSPDGWTNWGWISRDSGKNRLHVYINWWFMFVGKFRNTTHPQALSTLRKIDGTEKVPLGHHLMVLFCKSTPILIFFTKKGTIFQNGSQRALFWLRLFSQWMVVKYLRWN